MFRKLWLIFFFSIWINGRLSGQNPGTPTNAILLKVSGGANLGMADLGKRFPLFATLPVELGLKTKSAYLYGLSVSPLLGNRVQIDSLYGGIIGPSQIIFDNSGFPGLIRYYMRGFTGQANISRVFKISEKWKYSGIELKLGGGIMQHRIKARFDAGRIPQIEDPYREGYDRLTNGLLLSQSVNFHYLNTESLSFFGGITFGQAFTQNRRSWDYSTMRQDLYKRKDFYTGLSFGIIIPVKIRSRTSTEYYD